MLEELAEGIWVVPAPLVMMGLHLGARMTVARLEDGGLLLHSPILIDDALKAEIDKIGKVTHIVAPNLFHHLYAGDAKRQWPDALLHGPQKLHAKRKDLSFDGIFDEAEPHPDWQGIRLITIGGTLLHETAIYHEASGTLISCDLIENFATSPYFMTRCYLKIAGIHGKPGWSRLLRWLYRDKRQARADFERLLAFGFDRLILAHGDVIESNGQRILREGMGWLLEQHN